MGDEIIGVVVYNCNNLELIKVDSSNHLKLNKDVSYSNILFGVDIDNILNSGDFYVFKNF